MIIRNYIFLGFLFLVISASIVVAAIVGSKHNHKTEGPNGSSSESAKDPLVGVQQTDAGNYGTYPQLIKRGSWNRTPYTAVAIFGASDCDDAHPRSHIYADTLRPAPYWQGRFTNGPVFGEYLAASTLTGKPIASLNYAYGDATVNNALVKVNAPDTRTQMEMYTKDISEGKIKRGSKTNEEEGRVLHCIWIGINDVVQIWNDVIKNGTFQNHNSNGPQTGFEHAVDRIKTEAKELIDQIKAISSNNSIVNKIKSDFLLMFLPPLEIVPNLFYQSRDLAKKNSTLASIYLDYVGKLTALYNSELGSGILNLQKDNHRDSKLSNSGSQSFSNVNVKYFDIPKYWYFVKENPDKYNFVNVIDACWNSTTGLNCQEPARWQYYDTLHPTTKMHQYLAQEITVQVNL